MRRKTPSRVRLLQSTLDLLVLRTLLAGPAHGHAIAKHPRGTSEDRLQVETGLLYPALHRQEAKDRTAPSCMCEAFARAMSFILDPADQGAK